MVDIFAITSRGLEPVSAAEMGALPGLQVQEVSYRRIRATHRGDMADLLKLRTIDDVFIDLETWKDIPTQRNALGVFKERSAQLQFDTAMQSISRVRPVSATPRFSVTANFVGRRNYTIDEIKAAIAAGIESRNGWQYTSEEPSEINIRIFIEHERAYLGLRINAAPLHRRAYKQAHTSGSLKPTVAAAMVHMAEIPAKEWVLDPLCGAGTILIEAALLGCHVLGGDHYFEVLQAATTNARAAGVRIGLQHWDAKQLPIASHSTSRIVTNLPWGRQIDVDEKLSSFYGSLCAEFARVAKQDGQIVLLTNRPELVHFEHWIKTVEIEISLFGQKPTILKFAPNSN